MIDRRRRSHLEPPLRRKSACAVHVDRRHPASAPRGSRRRIIGSSPRQQRNASASANGKRRPLLPPAVHNGTAPRGRLRQRRGGAPARPRSTRGRQHYGGPAWRTRAAGSHGRDEQRDARHPFRATACRSLCRRTRIPRLPRAIGPRRRSPPAGSATKPTHVRELLAQARLPDAERKPAQATAADLVRRVRARARDQGAIEAFMRQYDLGSEEGVLLMCVAEALLRIPDQDTADTLIRDKLGDADWKRHLGQSRLGARQRLDLGPDADRQAGRPGRRHQARRPRRLQAPGRPRRRTGDPPGRAPGHAHHGPPVRDGPHHRRSAVAQPQGRQRRLPLFLRHAGRRRADHADAARYLEAYRKAIHAIGRPGPFADVFAAPSISVKLSALHPRYEHAKRARVHGRTGAQACWSWRSWPSATASASPSTPRKPTASNCRWT